MNISLNVQENIFQLATTFTISRGSRNEARVVSVKLSDGENNGWGESVPYARYDETVEGVVGVIESLRGEIENGMNREMLQSRLPAGAARNAIDCAFWDLEAKQAGKHVFELAGILEPKPCITAYTLSLDEPQAMHTKAKENSHYPLLKIKLGGEGDLERLEAVRDGAPDSDIIVDANEGWDKKKFIQMMPLLIKCGVKMVEQPFPDDDDDALKELEHSLPICADESCHDRESLGKLVGKYEVVNIKLDKTGGLTEALALRGQAEKMGFKIMVGSMVGSSLSMAPAQLVAQGVDYVDLDGPLLLKDDRETPIMYSENGIHPPTPKLWG